VTAIGSAQPRIDGLDGLRGLAISLVLLTHVVGVEGAGMVGVLLFFVLSGYLITSLLLGEGDRTSRIRLTAFYWRRAARLLPALLAFLALFVGVLVLVDGGDALGAVTPGLAQALLYVTDLTLGFQGAYRPELAHLWSLAVEEQFYLIWPICLVLLLRAGATDRLRRVAAALALFAVVRAASMALAPSLGLFVYALPTTWIDVLLVGALCALVRRDAPAVWERFARANSAWVTCPAMAVLLAYSIIPGSYRWPGTYVVGLPVLAVASCSLVLDLASSRPSWVKVVFTWGPLRAVGVVSYGVYLYNSTSIMLIQRWLGEGLGPRALGLGVAVALALLSWLWLERPVQRVVRDRLSSSHRHAPITGADPVPSVPEARRV
jgi:peptidoglycan/LPS O-acetylase OafA/YrhL